MYELKADEITRHQCQARTDYKRCKKYKDEKIRNLTEENAILNGEVTLLTDKNTILTDEITLLKQHIAELEASKN